MTNSPITTLYGLTISPWSIKARWTLDWHGLPYRWKEYTTVLTPMLMGLRWRLPAHRITAPFLMDGHRVLMSAHDIAMYADDHGHHPRLVQHEHNATVAHWDQVSNHLAEAGRALMMSRMLVDEAGQMAALPSGIPLPLRRRMRFMARQTAMHLSQKYKFNVNTPSHYRGEVTACMNLVRAALQQRQSELTLTPRFSYADMAVAAALQLVEPVSARFVPIPAGTRSLWTDPDLAQQYADVLVWRDLIFERYWRLPGAPHPSESQSHSIQQEYT